MPFLIDEDVFASVGEFLSQAHDVVTVVEGLGSGAQDADVVALARAQGAILVTADRKLAAKLRQTRRARCLYLRDLRTAELDRVVELIDVIESESARGGERFWMQISAASFVVQR